MTQALSASCECVEAKRKSLQFQGVLGVASIMRSSEKEPDLAMKAQDTLVSAPSLRRGLAVLREDISLNQESSAGVMHAQPR